MSVDTTDPDATRAAADGIGDFDDDDLIDASDPPPGTVSKGGRRLTDLADALRGAGLKVKELGGWEKRERGGTGYRQEGPVAIIVHHTGGFMSNVEGEAKSLALTHAASPLCNLFLDRSGQWWVLAAGATNTNGKGGPLGPLPADSANSRVIGIEAGNNGSGEPWPDVMQDSYVAGVAALAQRYKIATANVYAHHEWAPSRKIDPAGPSRFGKVKQHHSWNMDLFRAAVDKRRGASGPVKLSGGGATPPKVSSTGATYTVQKGDSWWSIATAAMGSPATNWPKLAAANGGAQRVLRPGDVLTIPGGKPSGGAPPAPAGVPPFPGAAALNDRGPIVLTWQQALIAKKVIKDNPDNRDQHYGPGLKAAVLKLQKSWGWSDADGKCGKHTWSKLHGGP